MEISNKLKIFLAMPKVQNLINDNKWDEVYELADSLLRDTKEFTQLHTREFTQLLSSVGISPLNYMTYIPRGYLAGTEITSFKIPSHIKTIKYAAFAHCYNLTNIVIPNSVVDIGEAAFNYCISLKNVTLGSSIEHIYNYAFNNCTSLTNITIPSSVTLIDGSAFNECTSLTNIVIKNGVTTIGKGAFNRCTSLTTLTIPDSVTDIRDWTFANCNSLSSITIGKNVINIGENIIFHTKVKSINYNNTMENWRKVNIAADILHDSLFKCTIHCIDGDLKYNGKNKVWLDV